VNTKNALNAENHSGEEQIRNSATIIARAYLIIAPVFSGSTG
jgi:hypothetical protein